MNGTRVLIFAMAVYFSAVLQQAVSHHLAIAGARPDFPLLMMALLCQYTSRSGGALLGFFFGLFHGVLPGANLTHYVLSRTMTGFMVSWSKSLGFEHSLLSNVVSVVSATVFAQVIWMFGAGPSNILGFFGDTIRTALYNGVLVVPMFALITKMMGPPGKSSGSF